MPNHSEMRESNRANRLPRLQKILADAGVASRRHAAAMIREGLVCVNDKVVREPGARFDPRANRITVEGVALPQPERCRTIMLHKPPGFICSTNPAQGRTVYSLLGPLRERLVPVGRLDRDSAGLLLLSNDGDLVARLTHPRHGHCKTYEVSVRGNCPTATLRRLEGPFILDGYRLQPVEVRRLMGARGRTLLRFVLREGRNRQIRRMCAEVGLEVLTLVRLAIDDLQLGDLAPGSWRDLTAGEIARLRGSRPTSVPTPKTLPKKRGQRG